MTATTWAMLVVVIAFEVLGDYLFKLWSASDRAATLAWAVGAYVAATVAWAPVIKASGLASATVLFVCGTLAAGVVVGALMGEDVAPRQWAGVAAAFAAIIMTEGA